MNNELIEKTLLRMRFAVNHLSNVIYNERDDEGSLDLLRGGCQIGMAWQTILFVEDDLKGVSIPGVDTEVLTYHLRTLANHCENMTKTARTDMDEIDLLKLGDLIGASRQMIYDIITNLARLIPETTDKTTDELKAEAVAVANPPDNYLFTDSVKHQREFEVLPPREHIDSNYGV